MDVGPIKSIRLRRLVLAAGLVLAVSPRLPADTLSPTEYEIKAAFLYNFAKFVEWPPETLQENPGHFVIGILGADPFGNDLDQQLEGKMVQDRTLVLRRISTVQEAAACNVLFISAARADQVETILSAIGDRPVLTVSDMSHFIQHGGIVGFSVEENRVRFSINMAAAARANLKVSSQLLKLAKTVISRRLSITQYAWLPFEIIPSAGN